MPDLALAGSQPTAKRAREGSVKDLGGRAVKSLVSSRVERPERMGGGFLQTACRGLPDVGSCVKPGMFRDVIA